MKSPETQFGETERYIKELFLKNVGEKFVYQGKDFV